MQHLLLFLEGIITFISPCLLPMLPIYISYFAAGKTDKQKTLKNALGFTLGFTVIFVIMGAFMGIFGQLLQEYNTALNIVTGSIVILFGLNFLGVFRVNFFNKIGKQSNTVKDLGFLSSILFGVIFSLSWMPCVGAFLGSALLLASLGGSMLQGISMLFAFSLGLGIPFIVSALLIDQLKTTFDFIKKNYKIINILSGSLLIIIGILMVTGYMKYFLGLLTF
ncbi:MAG: cytochrome c biogenesis CcdA family protein [Bacillota bacterium]